MPNKYFILASRVKKTFRKRVLKIINKCWSFKITSFFSSRNENEKTFCQLLYFINYDFSYDKAQYLVNIIMIKRLLTDILHHLFRYNITTAN